MTVPDTATDHDQIARLVTDLYHAVLQGDRAGFDRHLDPDITTWETHLPDLLRGKGELDTYRDRRAADGAQPSLSALAVEHLLIDVHTDRAVARYHLVAKETDQTVLLFRVTDVLRRDGDRWTILHHHSERCDPPTGTG